MTEHTDNNIRDAVFLKYLNSNIVLLLINLGTGIAAHRPVRLNRIFVTDEDGMADFCEDFIEAEVSVKIYDKPEQASYYLVDIYYKEDAQGGYINLNTELLKTDFAKQWSQKR